MEDSVLIPEKNRVITSRDGVIHDEISNESQHNEIVQKTGRQFDKNVKRFGTFTLFLEPYMANIFEFNVQL